MAGHAGITVPHVAIDVSGLSDGQLLSELQKRGFAPAKAGRRHWTEQQLALAVIVGFASAIVLVLLILALLDRDLPAALVSLASTCVGAIVGIFAGKAMASS